MPDNSARIEQITQILEAGVSKTVVDGVVTEFDLDTLRQERRELIRTDTSGNYPKRRTISGVSFG